MKNTQDPYLARQLSVFFPRGVTPTSKFVCVLPFPDGDARRHRDLSWFGQEKALRPAGGEICIDRKSTRLTPVTERRPSRMPSSA